MRSYRIIPSASACAKNWRTMFIESIEQYIKTVFDLQAQYRDGQDESMSYPSLSSYSPFIFRGHNDRDYKLMPGIFRTECGLDKKTTPVYSQDEYTTLIDFISHSSSISNLPANQLVPWLEIAQHYGVPTRLLDFTTNPLVALYFACEGGEGKNASVWVLHEARYKCTFCPESDGKPFDPVASDRIVWEMAMGEICPPKRHNQKLPQRRHECPWIYRPFYRYERMVSQSSVFMLWGSNKSDLAHFMKQEHYMDIGCADPDNEETGLICELVIPSGSKSILLRQLDTLGVNERFIYPGLDGIGRDVRRRASLAKA